MNPTWFDRHWCYIGLAAAVALLLIAFCTNTFRQRLDISRWRDPVWLSWLMVPVYFIHQFEEYGFDATGRTYGFPQAMCAMFGYSLANCPIPASFFPFVNIPAMWIGAPIAALLARRNHAVGLGYLGVLAVNAVVHLAPVVAGQGYGPGLLTAMILFVPLSAWIIHSCFGSQGLRYQTLAAILLAGVLLHVVLIGSIQLVIHGALNTSLANAIQAVNPLWLFVLPWLANTKWPPVKQDSHQQIVEGIDN
jgi:hypothetical protein